jgi:hypothetical protein
MQIQSRYFFDGIARLSYGWENPNHAAAVLVCLIPLLWVVESVIQHNHAQRAWLYVTWLGEAFVSLLLALTYSRGGGLAWLASLLFFGLICVGRLQVTPPEKRSPEAAPSTAESGVPIGQGGARCPQSADWAGRVVRALAAKRFINVGRHSSRWRFLLPRLALFGILLLSTGLVRRFALVAAGDNSSGNRLELWRGGLQLIDVSPLTGWGKGESGLAYMQWLQDPGAKASYGGMVNTYLHSAVEFGIPAFTALCFILLLPIVAAFTRVSATPPGKQTLLCGCAAGLVAFSVAGIFSTLWILPSVIWAPIGLLVVAGYVLCDADWPSLRRIGLRTSAVAVILGFALYGGAVIAVTHAPWRLTRLPGGAVRFVAINAIGEREVTFLPDGRTLGAYYGKELRGAIGTLGQRIDAFTIYPLDAMPKKPLTGHVVVFGPRVQDVNGIEGTATIDAVSPVGRPPVAARLRRLFLPEYDQLGYIPFWRSWAKANNLAIQVVADAGQDARAQWPRILRQCLEQNKP